ncbi:MAE_28990/MAE_18760 family HEPN-like nuclease [Xanthomonas campestris]|uniref:MAE_28990/MAE_18760 family HEPN-like nuclease n=1 Tax=Xanthomonas campestris TaxID=339 RepID=UPI00101AD9AD|nr:MAE_28990/MAE_18760 family HEPN-like nuclease [Xanthomonas campestris]MCD0253937.1 hypothetical protein [Xanthomonas campestris pv. campestris]MEB1302383.1 MAE_28990/MAE_18760 family HEPN-like nuclease [Xanthomonas campestris pv. campestris]MEB1310799.1 MAE_28990/MAE_18760 family HEPN-like nuclease [Xanthomonas campestris pv. campestris]MEB1335716.1 MAE_28990/MAE_18760 family HEPN-like nuclease [Xanthomonas campestris pv. campestris]MEB1900995.1 MAE_28990/MAE_18760 family HEPN-like nuclease
MSVLNALTDELNWRETEIASMRILLLSGSGTPSQQTVLLRAAWALLYAHYEGFCKNALVIFFDAACNSGVLGRDLPQATKLLSLASTLRRLKSLPDLEILQNIENFSHLHLIKAPVFPEVDTKSNLWPNVLIDLMNSADLRSDKVEENRSKLHTLVARRNKIAHGENSVIPEFSYYKSYEDAVYDVIYDLAYQIADRLQTAPYMRSI